MRLNFAAAISSLRLTSARKSFPDWADGACTFTVIMLRQQWGTPSGLNDAETGDDAKTGLQSEVVSWRSGARGSGAGWVAASAPRAQAGSDTETGLMNEVVTLRNMTGRGDCGEEAGTTAADALGFRDVGRDGSW